MTAQGFSIDDRTSGPITGLEVFYWKEAQPSEAAPEKHAVCIDGVENS